jgi:hypothetical protein
LRYPRGHKPKHVVLTSYVSIKNPSQMRQCFSHDVNKGRKGREGEKILVSGEKQE